MFRWGERSIYFLTGLLFSVVLIGITLVNLRGIINLSLAQHEMVDRANVLVSAQRRAIEMQVDFKKQVQEWKNILIRGTDPQDYKKYLRQFEEREEAVRGHLYALKSKSRYLEGMGPEIDRLLKTHLLLGEEYRAALEYFDREDPTSYAVVDRIVRGIDRQPQADMEQLVSSIQFFGNQELAKGLNALERKRAGVFLQSTIMVGVGLVLTVLFLSWLYSNYRDLNRAKEEALQASRAKGEFLANVSHEIRTPLNGAIGMVEILQRTELDSKQREYLDIVQSSSQTLLAILNDILDYSKIESGNIDLDLGPIDLDALIRSVLDLFQPRARTKNLHLRYKIADNISSFVEGDEIRMRQILLNLVYNAIKFTDSGHIEIRVHLGSDEAKIGEPVDLHFAVEDTGIGIDETVLPNLFQPFKQADNSATRKVGGTGLGLTICRNLVELMGGKIEAQSSPGSGSTFSFTVKSRLLKPEKSTPKEPPSVDSEKTEAEDTPLPTAKILLAEDNEVNRRVALLYLKRMDLEADWVENGKEAIERVAETPYDIILMDMQMPLMDGVEATREIRKMTGQEEYPWIIALTAGALQENREQAFAAGFNDYVTKPVHFTLLRDKLHEHIRKAARKAGALSD